MQAFGRVFVFASLLGLLAAPSIKAQDGPRAQPLDERVKAFLAEQQYGWRDMNVPAKDGQFLHDLIVEHGYKRALEIGTSTGHSGIWIAWALSKTGGKLITIEIDEERHKEALANFEKAGVARFVDARLADAHELVKKLPGPFDFVFSDADKEWYKQYFIDVAPKMAPGGCYATHNVSMRGRGWGGGNRDYVDYLMSQPEFETSVETTRTSGIAVSFRKRD
jgi:caffeoyl-CoA O-methyltransferase